MKLVKAENRSDFERACAAFVTEHIPDLQRALEEGYEIVPGVMQWVLEAIGRETRKVATSVRPVLLVRDRSSLANRLAWEERPAPFEKTLVFRDAIVKAVAGVPLPAHVTATVERVMRVEFHPEDASGVALAEELRPQKFTAIVVEIVAPGEDLRWVIVPVEGGP